MSDTPEHSSASQHGETAKQRRKLHQDWRMWLIVLLMLAAMAIYLMTLDLR